MPVYLIPADHEDSPVPVDKPVLLIGRQAECDVILTCSRKVSRRHCCVVQISDWYVVRDLGSTNGIAVNGEPVANEAKFGLGDTLTVGDVEFELVEGKFSVPKGKVCIGPKLKSQASRGGAERKPKPHGGAANFRGIPASRPRRDGVRDDGRSARPTPPRSPSGRDDEVRDRTAAGDVPAANEDSAFGKPDEFGSDTFGSDIENEEFIAETFGSDMQDSVEPETFPIRDEGDDDLDHAMDTPVSPRGGEKAVRGTLDPFADGEHADLVYEDEEPASQPEPKRRKSRPRDSSLREDERLDVDDAVDRGSVGNGNADSIIELDEFDLLD